MYKNIKVILIGGSPMSGKTSLAARLSTLYGYSNISTDDIGEILQTVSDINPMKGFDYREYYIQKPLEELVNEAYEYHKKIFPAVERLISIHSNWGSPIIIEGWALYPKMLKNIASENIKKIWLICEWKVLQERLAKNRPFISGASEEEAMMSKYLKRSMWHNNKILNECKASGEKYIYIANEIEIEELLQKSISLLNA
jgi:2-phosphoglycerate kinase